MTTRVSLDKDRVCSLFEATARDYHEAREQAFSFQTQKRLVLELLDGARGAILDVGCGPAVMAKDLLERGFEVWGIDLSATMIDYGRARLRALGLQDGCHLSVADVEHLAFRDRCFDAVICMGVFEYLPSHAPAIREIHRVLKPGGTAVISMPRRGSPYELASRAYGVAARLLGRARRHPPELRRNPCMPHELERELEQAGFRNLDARDCTFRFLPGRVWPTLSVKLEQRLDSVRAAWFRRWMGAQYIVRAERAA